MSDFKAEKKLTSAKLQNGDIVHINDHVYLAPEHLGEAYYIGRVMEFCTSSKRKGLQARIAWFNRPKDVINRKTSDPRLLVATMHSDVNPVSSIRGKCIVTHKYYLEETVEQYRKKPDHFYYNQLYDRYIQRVYDVVPCASIQNLPEDILQALSKRYQYVVVEQGNAANLTLTRRICCVCQEWCPNKGYVSCSGCLKNYHLHCVNPPLTKKPSKGFAWQCAFCARKVLLGEEQQEEEGGKQVSVVAEEENTMDSDETTAAAALVSLSATPTPPPPSNRIIGDVSKETIIKPDRQRTTRSQAPKPKVTTEQQPRKETSIKIKLVPKPAANSSKQRKGEIMTEMWPFRYFGVNSDVQRIFDRNDEIYPRAQSRIGTRYQANVLEETATDRSVTPASESGSHATPKPQTIHKPNKRYDKKGKSVERSKPESPGDSSQSYSESMTPMRGTDETVTPIFSQPSCLGESELDNYMQKVKNLPDLPLSSYSSDLMDRALFELELNNYNTDIALDHMSRLNKDDFKHAEDWSREQVEAFEQSIREHGHELNFAKRAVSTKPMADVVRFFYQWKKTDRYEPVYSTWTKIFKPTKNFKKAGQREGSVGDNDGLDETNDSGEESDPTVIPISAKKHYQCMNCQTDQSTRWRRSPSDTDRKRKQFKQVLCDECGIYWLKYSTMKPTAVPKPKRHLEPEITTTTITPTPLIKRKKSNEPNLKPIAPKKQKEDTSHLLPSECKLCCVVEPEELIYTCQTCGMSVHSDCYGIKNNTELQGWRCDPCDNKVNPVASYTYECIICHRSTEGTQQPLKRTTGYKWAHVQCAMFIPEVKFVDTSTLSPVEYIGCINTGRNDQNCQLCHSHAGSCVACSECSKPIHVQCAIDHQFKLAFEIQTNIIQKMVNKGLFGPSSPAGFMIPQVWCPEHAPPDEKLVNVADRTASTRESSLRAYARIYKGISPKTTPAMRRFRATRMHPYNNVSKIHKVPMAREAAIAAIEMKEVLDSPPPSSFSSIAPRKQKQQSCSKKDCKVKHSPIWWDTSPISGSKLCHWCYLNQ